MTTSSETTAAPSSSLFGNLFTLNEPGSAPTPFPILKTAAPMPTATSIVPSAPPAPVATAPTLAESSILLPLKTTSVPTTTLQQEREEESSSSPLPSLSVLYPVDVSYPIRKSAPSPPSPPGPSPRPFPVRTVDVEERKIRNAFLLSMQLGQVHDQPFPGSCNSDDTWDTISSALDNRLMRAERVSQDPQCPTECTFLYLCTDSPLIYRADADVDANDFEPDDDVEGDGEGDIEEEEDEEHANGGASAIASWLTTLPGLYNSQFNRSYVVLRQRTQPRMPRESGGGGARKGEGATDSLAAGLYDLYPNVSTILYALPSLAMSTVLEGAQSTSSLLRRFRNDQDVSFVYRFKIRRQAVATETRPTSLSSTAWTIAEFMRLYQSMSPFASQIPSDTGSRTAQAQSSPSRSMHKCRGACWLRTKIYDGLQIQAVRLCPSVLFERLDACGVALVRWQRGSPRNVSTAKVGTFFDWELLLNRTHAELSTIISDWQRSSSTSTPTSLQSPRIRTCAVRTPLQVTDIPDLLWLWEYHHLPVSLSSSTTSISEKISERFAVPPHDYVSTTAAASHQAEVQVPGASTAIHREEWVETGNENEAGGVGDVAHDLVGTMAQSIDRLTPDSVPIGALPPGQKPTDYRYLAYLRRAGGPPLHEKRLVFVYPFKNIVK